MSKTSFNQTFNKQQSKLVRATFKKGFVSAVNANNRTVDVSFAENPLTIVRNIRIANNVTIASIVVGQRCRVDVFDETNPNDQVMAYTY